MKRTLLFLIVYILIFSLFSCSFTKEDEQSKDLDSMSSEESATADESLPDERDKIPQYLHLIPKGSLTEAKAKIKGETTETILQFDNLLKGVHLLIDLPVGINVLECKTDGIDVYEFAVDNVIIGELRLNDIELTKNIKKTTNKTAFIDDAVGISDCIIHCSDKEESWDIPVYRMFLYNTFKTPIVFYIRQDVISYNTAQDIVRSMKLKYSDSITGAGKYNFVNTPCRALVLGNSFLWTSQVANTLNEIAKNNDKDFVITEHGVGNAGVSTFAQDYNLLSQIASGDYDFIFVCGFYSNNCDEYLLRLACETPENSKMIIFPAHNEFASEPYKNFYKRYDYIGLADWKGFINKLISDGMNPLRLYIEDIHHHSNELAGYAGACLIYSYIYKEIPEPGEIERIFVETQTKLTNEEMLLDLELIREQAYKFLYE